MAKQYPTNKPSLEPFGLEGYKDTPSKRVRHYWLTPPDLFRALDDEFNFTYDPCPHPRPSTFDALTSEWGQSNFVNPPFRKNMNAWIHKGIEEHRKGKTVVFLIPTVSYMALLIREKAEFRSLGRMPFLAIEDGSQQPGPMEIILAILRGDKTGLQ